MGSIRKRAMPIFASVMRTVLNRVQALTLELLWTRSRTIRNREARI